MSTFTAPDALAAVAVAHQQLAQALPPDMVAALRWVAWRYQQRGGKRTKVPVGAQGRPLDATHATNCTGLLGALSWCAQHACDGVGFALGDGYVGVDLDHCRDPVTGHVEAWAQAVVAQVDSYTEVSPSGTGVHCIARGGLPSGGRRKGGIEMYATARFFTVTGDHVAGTPQRLEERTTELATLHAEWFGAAQPLPARQAPSNGAPSGDDAAIVEAVARGDHGAKVAALWRGEWAALGYPSQSEADLALCAVLAARLRAGADTVDRLFRLSGLYRPKWDERRGSAAYGAITVAKAVEGGHRTAGAGGAPCTGQAFALTDLGNAERLVARHGHDLRYCRAWRKWLVWDGCRWAVDATGEVERRANQTVRAIYQEAQEEPDADRRAALAKHAVRSEAESRLRDLVQRAQTEPGIPIKPEQLDTDPWLLNVQNGTLDLRTGVCRPHDRCDLLTKLAPVAYDPHAQAPLWAAFLDLVMGGNAALIGFLQREAGYALTGDTSERAIFIHHGRGRNGKTTFAETLAHVLGDYATATRPETLLAKRGDPIPNDLAALKGARLVFTSETEGNKHLAESLVKQLTGRDTMKARFLYGEYFDFTPAFKVLVSTNHKPVIHGADEAIWDRIRLVPWNKRIPDSSVDKHLLEKLRAEAPGILAGLVAACLDWQRDGLGAPPEVVTATQEYRDEMDPLAEFIEACCVVGEQCWALATALYKAYTAYAEEALPKHARLTQTAFGLLLAQRFERKRGERGNRYTGVGLRALGM